MREQEGNLPENERTGGELTRQWEDRRETYLTIRETYMIMRGWEGSIPDNKRTGGKHTWQWEDRRETYLKWEDRRQTYLKMKGKEGNLPDNERTGGKFVHSRIKLYCNHPGHGRQSPYINKHDRKFKCKKVIFPFTLCIFPLTTIWNISHGQDVIVLFRNR
jgi:hypothetical protein